MTPIRHRLTDAAGYTSSYSYDSLNRLTGLTNTNSGSFGFGYDALGRRPSLTRPNGVNTSYSYDTLTRLLGVLHNGGALPGSASYTYDAAGNRLTKTAVQEASPNPVSVLSQYSYDNIHELTQASINAKERKASNGIHMKGMHHAKPSRETDVGNGKTIPFCHTSLLAVVCHLLLGAMLERSEWGGHTQPHNYTRGLDRRTDLRRYGFRYQSLGRKLLSGVGGAVWVALCCVRGDSNQQSHQWPTYLWVRMGPRSERERE